MKEIKIYIFSFIVLFILPFSIQTLNAQMFEDVNSFYAIPQQQAYTPFSEELPSERYYNDFQSNPNRVAQRIGALDDLNDDPNDGDDPGIGFLPLNDSFISILIFALLFVAFKGIIRKFKTL